MDAPEKVLEVRDLHVEFRRDGSSTAAVKDVSFEVYRGRTLGIVGESGSGKSVSCLAVMGLLPKSATVTGHAWLQNTPQPASHSDNTEKTENSEYSEYSDNSDNTKTDLLTLNEDAYLNIRGCRIGMIFQEPMTSLNPVHRCGDQVMEMLLAHERVSRDEARQRVLDLFEEVMLPRPEKIFSSYPHEISGGQKQRVMIAMALICHPDLIIADEPTTALDVTVQQTILQLLRSLQQRHHIGIIFITHDLGVIGQIADDVAVMYKGEIVEQGTAQQVLYHPRHPYTQGLLACRPPLDSRPRRLPTVQDYLSGKAADADSSAAPAPANLDTDGQPATPLLRVRGLQVTYPLRKSLFGRVLQSLNAVDGLTFDIYRGETLGLVGESGCGKSTLGRAILHLIERSAGTVEYDGVSLDKLSRSQRKELRRKMQIVFQDPYSSLNPRLTIGEAIMEPLLCHHLCPDAQSRRQRALELMQQVGLDTEWFNRYPHEFSGGQRQRVCIARALVLQPELVVCDESVSALDVSVQAQVLNLLNDLKERFGYTYLFITHDLSVVKFFSDRIMVMERGRIVEQGPSDQLFANPQHPYTQRLLAAIPRL
ncbi:MAG: ABC transporter ATP-binding protein [Bacteroidales bacterium]|nr:ABC transporter ATP-binding protein [Bacteroidales bacterium]